MQGDSETEGPDSSDDGTESPILCSGLKPSQHQAEISVSQNTCAFDALADLDSMLDYPMSQAQAPVSKPVIQLPARTVHQSQTANAHSKVRSLDQVVLRMPTGSITSSSLSANLDLMDMRLLIHACGEKIGGSLTKPVYCARLLALHENGSLSKICNMMKFQPELEEPKPTSTQLIGRKNAPTRSISVPSALSLQQDAKKVISTNSLTPQNIVAVTKSTGPAVAVPAAADVQQTAPMEVELAEAATVVAKPKPHLALDNNSSLSWVPVKDGAHACNIHFILQITHMPLITRQSQLHCWRH